MDKRLYITYLYDFYSMLLTEKQRSIFEMYYLNDFSFAEIGEILKISKQGVRDSVVKAENALSDYENKLCLFEKYKQRDVFIDSLIQNYDFQDVVIEKLNELKKM